MIQAIFFDFNGVIIDDERLQMKAYQQVLGSHGIELTEEQYLAALGMDDKTFVYTALQRAGRLSDDLTRAVLQAKAAAHRKLIENSLPLFPGVVTFLKAAARHYALGLVSMASDLEISYVLERTRLRALFRVIVSAESVSACKPAPDCYQCGLDKLNRERRASRLSPLLSQQCLAVEDSPPGIQSAMSVGMRTLGVTNTVSENELRAAGAEVVTHNLSDWTMGAVNLVFSD